MTIRDDKKPKEPMLADGIDFDSACNACSSFYGYEYETRRTAQHLPVHDGVVDFDSSVKSPIKEEIRELPKSLQYGSSAYINHGMYANGDQTMEGPYKVNTSTRDVINQNDSSASKNELIIDSEEELQGADCFCKQMGLWFPSLYRKCLKYPRSNAIFLGVFLPMTFLIVISLFLGFILARMEAPLEIQQNDVVLSQTRTELTVFESVVNITSSIPQICLDMYFGGKNLDLLPFYLQQVILHLDNITSNVILDPGVLVTVNSSELLEYVTLCGDMAGSIVEEMLKNTNLEVSFDKSNGKSSTGLTFNWIRCFPGANGFDGTPSVSLNLDDFQYQNQSRYYIAEWKKSQLFFFDVALKKLLAENVSLPTAEVQATSLSYKLATGADACGINYPASGWWWFILLTTVGYGNYVPNTSPGRVMVQTFGFLSILAFAGLLAMAGTIISAIFDDAMVHLRFKAITHPCVAVIVWGSLYYLWMTVIAVVATKWFHIRLGKDSFDEEDGYWFAFVSSTTVGFGDIYFPPEVFLYSDLVCFSFMWLISFVLVSAFLSKLSEGWISLVGKRTSFIQILLTRLQSSDVLKTTVGNCELIGRRLQLCCWKADVETEESTPPTNERI